MQMRALFPGGPLVSVVGVTLSEPPCAGQPLRRTAALAPGTVDPDESGERAMADALASAVACGVNLIDSDWISQGGHAQEVLGRALQRIDTPLVLSGKAGPRLAFRGELLIDNSRANLLNQAQDSLFRLKGRAFDLYSVHWPDSTAPAQTARGLDDARHGGHTRFVGACNFSTVQASALHAVLPLQVISAPLNLLQRDALDTLLPWCVQSGVGFVALDPLADGLLAGRFTGSETFAEADPLFTQPRFGQACDYAKSLHKRAQEAGLTGAQMALAWVLQQPGVSAALIPVSEPARIAELCAAADLQPDTSNLAP